MLFLSKHIINNELGVFVDLFRPQLEVLDVFLVSKSLLVSEFCYFVFLIHH
jgi:hypothetical protein